MGDLDRRSLEVAISILQTETESPGSQKPASIKIARQILAQLQPPEQRPKEIFAGSAFDSAISGSGSDFGSTVKSSSRWYRPPERALGLEK